MNGNGVTAVLLLSCADQRGLVASVSDFLYRHDGNIIHADQHTDREEGVFLQRVEWELESFKLGRDEIAAAFRPLAERFDMTWRLHFSDYVPRIAIFASRLGHCAFDLLARWRLGEFRAEIPLVISNHPDLEPIARDFGVRYACCPVTAETKAEQETRIVSLLAEERIDVLILARYMQVLSDGFVARYPRRIINIHHSFLPAFAGARPYHKAHERGVKIIGATAHYVTSDLDEGPIIEQDVIRVTHAYDVDALTVTGRDVERQVLARAVKYQAEDRLLLIGNRVVVFP